MRLRELLNRSEQKIEDMFFGGARVKAAEKRLHESTQRSEEVMEDATKTLIGVKTKRKPNGTA